VRTNDAEENEKVGAARMRATKTVNLRNPIGVFEALFAMLRSIAFFEAIVGYSLLNTLHNPGTNVQRSVELFFERCDVCVMCVMWVFSSLLGIGFEFRGCAMLEKAMVRGAKGSDGQTTTRD
jgi:hypothetical protein